MSPTVPTPYPAELCLDLLQTLYDEVDERLSNWVAFLAQLTEVTASRAAMVRSSNQRTGEGGALTGARLTSQELEAYGDVYHPAAVVQFRLQNPQFTEPGAVAPIDLSRGEAAASLVGRALSRVGFGHLLNAVIDRDGPVVFSVTLLRSPAEPAFGEAEVALLRRLSPHLTRAARISRNLRYLAGVNGALTHSLDSLPVGMMLLDAQAKLLVRNRAAAELLERRAGLRLDRRGRLRPERADARTAFERLIAAAATSARGPGTAPAGTLALRRAVSESPLLLLAVPAGEVHTGLLASEGTVALFATDPRRQAPTDHPTLRGLWGLSPAEVRVARLLVQGRSLPEIAAALEVRPSTVRTHLNRIFDKTGARRQTELVGLLSWSVAALELLASPG